MSPAESNFLMFAKLAGIIEYVEEDFLGVTGRRITTAETLRWTLRAAADWIDTQSYMAELMVRDYPERWGMIAQAFADLVAERPELQEFYDRAKLAAD